MDIIRNMKHKDVYDVDGVLYFDALMSFLCDFTPFQQLYYCFVGNVGWLLLMRLGDEDGFDFILLDNDTGILRKLDGVSFIVNLDNSIEKEAYFYSTKEFDKPPLLVKNLTECEPFSIY